MLNKIPLKFVYSLSRENITDPEKSELKGVHTHTSMINIQHAMHTITHPLKHSMSISRDGYPRPWLPVATGLSGLGHYVGSPHSPEAVLGCC